MDDNKLFNYNNLKNYDIDTMLEIILSLNEDDKINLFRDNDFINNIDSIYLGFILNNMSFTSVFGMFQNKLLLNKINKIDIKLTPKDHVLFKSCLEYPDLINKISNTMLKNMLINFSKEEILSYFKNNDIINNLNNNDIIEIAAIKNIDLLAEFNYFNKLNDDEIIYYIDSSFKNKVNYNLINNDRVKKIFPNVDMNEVIYLYDLLTTKSNQNIKEISHSFSSFKAILNAYYILGLNKSITLCDNSRSINDIEKVFNNIDINKLNNNSIDFINKYYNDILDHKYDLSLDFSTIVNNYNNEYLKFKNIYSIEEHLIDNNIVSKNPISSMDYYVDNNIAYINDNKDYNNNIIKVIANNLLKGNINYVIINTKRDLDGIRLSSEQILINNNLKLSNLLNNKSKVR